MTTRTLLIALAAFSLAGAAHAQPAERPIPRMPAKQELPDDDRTFLRDAAAAEWRLREIAAVAREKVKDGKARDLSDNFGREKAAAVSDIEKLAGRKQVVLPPHDPKIRADWVRKGNFGDALFVDAMVDELRAAVRVYEQGARSTDREIADFANRRLNELRKQFESAREQQLDNIDRSRRR